MLRIVALLALFFLEACGTTKPCAEGGDAVPYPQIRGNRQCTQKQLKSGKYVNEGRYVIWHSNGKIAIEGVFRDGLMHGTWIQYDEKGKKVAVKDYSDGREVLPANPEKTAVR